ncbi:MAG: MBL fold metallo-hydrolase [Deltaproteobacteria bacterium]|nr:MBL fold metallo-hydrolase [Deltaproteobacteria bacterium]
MIEEVAPELYRLEIPLPGSHLKWVNSYLVRGSRSLLIDTGWSHPRSQAELASGLNELGIDPARTDLFITHLHSDHSGQAGSFVSSSVYFNRVEADEVNAIGAERERQFRAMGELFARHGFPRDDLGAVANAHLGSRYGLQKPVDFRLLGEGDTVNVGGYKFTCLETPGHSPGHLCLYEPAKRLLIAGDHLLAETPDVDVVYSMSCPDQLGRYLRSLDRVLGLDVALVLPGHGPIFANHRERISELKRHHEARLEELVKGLAGGPRSLRQLIAGLRWHQGPWEALPPLLRFFAFGEVLAHLENLEGWGRVVRKTMGDGFVFEAR